MSFKRWSVAWVALVGSLVAWGPGVGADTRSVTLEWTAPGDDAWIGKATAYDVRYSRLPITDANFDFANRLNTAQLPGASGTHERLTVFGLTQGVAYFFALRTVDDAGNWSPVSNIAYVAGDVADVAGVPLGEPQFSAPWPNPARGRTVFSVTLPKSDQLRIEAFDLAGRKVKTIATGQYAAGTFDVRWDLSDESGHRLAAGAYMVRSQLGESVFLRRVNVIY